jgi:hypothetical protein
MQHSSWEADSLSDSQITLHSVEPEGSYSANGLPLDSLLSHIKQVQVLCP